MKKRLSVFEIVNYIILGLVGIICLYPFYNVVVGSFLSFEEYLSNKNKIFVFPTKFVLDSYKFIFSTDTFFTSLRISIIVTILGTIFSMLITSMYAYPLSKNKLKGKRLLSLFIIIPMMFSGGLIPYYFVVRSVGLINTIWALIIPGSLSPFYIILMKNFFISLPESMEESARIDGANDLIILFKIILPLSMPIIATLSLFYAVGYWNDYFRAVIFINNAILYPIQNLLRQILIDNSLETLGKGMSYFSSRLFETSHTIKMAIIVIATVPIICVYPFLQKYYIQGMMSGAIKG